MSSLAPIVFLLISKGSRAAALKHRTDAVRITIPPGALDASSAVPVTETTDSRLSGVSASSPRGRIV
ncbi:hypothetical protein [Paenibacillus harenae]|uniref:hypothetical protein n=1 Tax=Paenibacillus harenae TaxID=306543 RepID=UPI000565BE41|nr:hypothetical protein [Paenibacillus harenae]